MTRRYFQSLLSMGSLVGVSAGVTSQADLPLLKPAKLRKGDRIGLISPGSPVPEAKVKMAQETTKSLGYRPVLGKYVFERNGYLAGTDQQRLTDLHDMFFNPEIKAVWCIRGGYGCTRLLNQLDYERIRKNAKIFIGYSDITALHLAIYKKSRLVTFHGPVASSAPTQYSLDNLRKALMNNGETLLKVFQEKNNPYPQPYTINPGSTSGQLTGGNLSLLAALAGTPWSPSYQDKLVFIEDIGEKPYRIDRMLVQLLQASDLANAAGIILGIFHNCEAKPGEHSLTLEQTLRQAFQPLKIPVAYGCSIGHIDDQITMPLGIQANFDADTHVITLLESATR